MSNEVREFTLINQNGDIVIHNIIGNYSSSEASSHALSITEGEQVGEWGIHSVVEVTNDPRFIEKRFTSYFS